MIYHRQSGTKARLLTQAVWFVISVLCTTAVRANSDAPHIVVSTAPLHSLVTAVTRGIAEPELLLGNFASLHHLSLKPSQARRIEAADLIIRTDGQLERFLDSPVAALAPEAKFIAVTDDKRLPRHTVRDSLGDWMSRSRPINANTLLQQARHAVLDVHVWLDPVLMSQWVEHLVLQLRDRDPVNSDLYQQNGRALQKRLLALDQEIRNQLTALDQREIIVNHDSFQYFERRYEIHAIAALHDHADNRVGAQSMRRLFNYLESGGRAETSETSAQPETGNNGDQEIAEASPSWCLVATPYEAASRAVSRFSEDRKIALATVDPLGTELTQGTELYFQMMRQLATNISNCLEAQG